MYSRSSFPLIHLPIHSVCNTLVCEQNIKLEGKYSLESTDPRESEIHAPPQLTIALKLSYYLFIIAKLFKVKDSCLKFVSIGKNSRFMAFLDSNLHTRLAIVTENELGLDLPPRNLPKKFRPDPSMFYLVIVLTNRQTDRQTYAGDYIIPRETFRWDKKAWQVKLCNPLSASAIPRQLRDK